MTRRAHTTHLPLISALAAALVGLGSPARAASAPDACFAGWSDAIPVAAREALTPVRDVHTLARQRKLGDLVHITLCSRDGRYVYHLLVREPLGRVVPMTVDARHPFIP